MDPNRKDAYTIRKAVLTPGLRWEWASLAWRQADILDVAHFHARSSVHRPFTQAKVLYDEACLYVFFRVEDRYVVSRHAGYQSRVCDDSCVEFFVQPKAGLGYFNFEMNCGGHLLLYYVEDPIRIGNDFKKRTAVPWELASHIAIYHSLPDLVNEEMVEATSWGIEYAVPLRLFEEYAGSLGALPGQAWRANFYKCADGSSHPHWASWAPIGAELNFHCPEFFGTIRFAE